MDPRTEKDHGSDTMERPVNLTVSQEEERAGRVSVKQRQEDRNREAEREARKLAATQAHKWTEGES